MCRSTIDDCDARYTCLGPSHFHATGDKQTEREREKEALVYRALEENANEAIEIHLTTRLEISAAANGDSRVDSVPSARE